MKDTLADKIRSAYWGIIPYEWRPHHVWYRFKCWSWRRYSTVKPRYLSHTWCDRSELMPHMMFEILCNFIEKECSPGHIEWYGEHGHKVGDKYAMDEMLELVDWWKNVYNKEYREVADMLWRECEKHPSIQDFHPIEDSDNYLWDPTFETEEDEEIHDKCLKAANKLDRMMAKALEDRLYRIIPLLPSMWT